MARSEKKRVPVPVVTHTHDDIRRLVKRGRLERSRAFHAALACLRRGLCRLIG